MNMIIKAKDNKVIPVWPKNGTDFQLDELREIVGGFIEIVYLDDKKQHLMVVNEEGKLLGLQPNVLATHLYNCNDVIVGDVLICENDKIK